MTTWLDQVNAYRGLANLPAVTEDPALSQADYNLAVYECNTLDHLDHLNGQTNNPNYTAAQNSNIFGSSSADASDIEAIDDWMSGVFHGIGIIDPRLKTVGFGSYRNAAATPHYHMVAALNNLQGLDWNITPRYPIMWPADGKTISLTTYSQGESPDARSKCGYTQPAGLPIFLQLGQGNVIGSVTGSLTLNGTTITVCEIDETNYTYSNPAWQNVGRQILQMRGAVVLLPSAPLANGTYMVEITVNGQLPYIWSFTVGPTVPISGLVHLQDIGDVSLVNDTFAGTRGQSRRLEGFQIQFNPPVPGLSMRYMAHLQDIGDVPWVDEGQFIGTRGQSRRLEGFAIELTGPEAVNYSVRYMAHLQDLGDTDFFRDGQFCGTRGQSRRIEGILVHVGPR